MQLEDYKVTYFIIVFLCFIIGFTNNSYNRNNKNRISYILIVGFALWIGYRPIDVGTDTLAYKIMFENQNNIAFNSFIKDGDPLFVLLLQICSLLGNYQTCFVLISFLVLLGSYWFARKICKAENVGSSLLLFLCVLSTHIFFNQQINIIRSGVSMTFFYFFFYHLYKKEYKKTIFYALISVGFHITMLIPIGILLLMHFFSLNDKVCLSIYFISLSLSFLNIGIHSVSDFLLGFNLRQVQSYLSGNDMDYKIGFRVDFAIFNTFFLVVFLYLKRFIKEDLFFSYSIKYYLLSSAVFFLWFYIPFSDRVGAYSWNFIPIILYMAICKKNPQKQISNGALAFIMIYTINLVLFVI